MDVILKQQDKTVVDDMVKFLKTLSIKEQQAISSFMQGIIYAKKLDELKKETA